MIIIRFILFLGLCIAWAYLACFILFLALDTSLFLGGLLLLIVTAAMFYVWEVLVGFPKEKEE